MYLICSLSLTQVANFTECAVDVMLENQAVVH